MLLLLAVVLLAATPGVGSSAATSTAWRVVASATFDASQVTLYWEGARISSPVTFTTDGRDIKLNGISALAAIPSDTAGVNASIAAVFAGVPFVDSLVAQGSSYEHAVAEYGCEMGRRLRRALQPSLAALRASSTGRGTPPLNSIAEAMNIPRDSIHVHDGSLECIVPVSVRLSVPLGVPDSALLADPCAPLSPEARRIKIEKRVASIVASLGESGSRLMIADQDRTSSYMGVAGERAMDQARQAMEIYKRGGADAVRRECKDFLIPPYVLIPMARRQKSIDP